MTKPINGYLYEYVGEVEDFVKTGTGTTVTSTNPSNYPKNGIILENGIRY